MEGKAMSGVILLGTHFMFREELGSRLRGIGHTVHPYDSLEDLQNRLESDGSIKLVIIDLQHPPSGVLKAIAITKDHSVPVLALGEHKKTELLQKARDSGADKVIINSQASKSIEKYVSQLIG